MSRQPASVPDRGAPCDPEDGCVTCGDVAVPMRILDLDAARGLALCSTERGQRATVEIALVGPVAVGDDLLVHAGTAIATLDADSKEAYPTGDRNAPGREAEKDAYRNAPGREAEEDAYRNAPGREAEEALR